jgi:hypothetical protein
MTPEERANAIVGRLWSSKLNEIAAMITSEIIKAEQRGREQGIAELDSALQAVARFEDDDDYPNNCD